MSDHILKLGEWYAVKDIIGEYAPNDHIKPDWYIRKKPQAFWLKPELVAGVEAPWAYIGQESILALDLYQKDPKHNTNLEVIIDPCFQSDMGEPTIKEMDGNRQGFLYRLSVEYDGRLYISNSELFTPNQNGMVQVYFNKWETKEDKDTPFNVDPNQLKSLKLRLDNVVLYQESASLPLNPNGKS